MHDITEEYTLSESLRWQAMMDELSGLSNRRAFIQLGKEMMLESEHYGKTVHLLMMDLDLFKKVNDQYGHRTGDRVIQYLSDELKSNFISNSLIARLGGEEFAVLISGLSDEQVEKKAQEFLEKVAFHEHH